MFQYLFQITVLSLIVILPFSSPAQAQEQNKAIESSDDQVDLEKQKAALETILSMAKERGESGRIVPRYELNVLEHFPLGILTEGVGVDIGVFPNGEMAVVGPLGKFQIIKNQREESFSATLKSGAGNSIIGAYDLFTVLKNGEFIFGNSSIAVYVSGQSASPVVSSEKVKLIAMVPVNVPLQGCKKGDTCVLFVQTSDIDGKKSCLTVLNFTEGKVVNSLESEARITAAPVLSPAGDIFIPIGNSIAVFDSKFQAKLEISAQDETEVFSKLYALPGGGVYAYLKSGAVAEFSAEGKSMAEYPLFKGVTDPSYASIVEFSSAGWTYLSDNRSSIGFYDPHAKKLTNIKAEAGISFTTPPLLLAPKQPLNGISKALVAMNDGATLSVFDASTGESFYSETLEIDPSFIRLVNNGDFSFYLADKDGDVFKMALSDEPVRYALKLDPKK